MYKYENFFMIHVLLASELSWQRNDTIMFFTSSYHPQLPQLWQSLNKFYESVLEIFQNEVLKVTKPVNKHAINIISYYLKKMMRSGYAVSSHSGLIPSETVYEKRGLLWPIVRKENLINVRVAAFFIIFICNLVHACKFQRNLKTV